MAALAELLKLNPFARKAEVPPPMTAEQANDALYLAISTGKASRKELAGLLAAGANPNAHHKLCSFTLLNESVTCRRNAIALQLLDHLEAKGIEPEQISYLLFKAIDRNLPELVERMLCMGASPDANPKGAQLPLVREALHSGYPCSMLQSLINHGAKLDHRDPDTKATILHYAVEADRADMIEVLLDAGMEVDATDKQGETALHKAARSDCGESLKALLKAGADLNARDICGYQAVHYAACRNRTQIMRDLAAAGADLNEPSFLGRSPSVEADKESHGDMRTQLYKLGAFIDDALRKKEPYSVWVAVATDTYRKWVDEGCDIHQLKPEIALACGNIGALKAIASPALWRGHGDVFAALSNKLPPYIVKQMLTCEPELATLFAKPKPVIEGWSAQISGAISPDSCARQSC